MGMCTCLCMAQSVRHSLGSGSARMSHTSLSTLLWLGRVVVRIPLSAGHSTRRCVHETHTSVRRDLLWAHRAPSVRRAFTEEVCASAAHPHQQTLGLKRIKIHQQHRSRCTSYFVAR